MTGGLLAARPTGAHLYPYRLSDIECATAEEINHWKGGESIPGLSSRASNWCLEARRGWCQTRRDSGRCMRTEQEYQYLTARDLAGGGTA